MGHWSRVQDSAKAAACLAKQQCECKAAAPVAVLPMETPLVSRLCCHAAFDCSINSSASHLSQRRLVLQLCSHGNLNDDVIRQSCQILEQLLVKAILAAEWLRLPCRPHVAAFQEMGPGPSDEAIEGTECGLGTPKLLLQLRTKNCLWSPHNIRVGAGHAVLSSHWSVPRSRLNSHASRCV